MKKLISFFEHNKVLRIVILGVYLLLLLLGLLNHEFWRDEFQAWTIARDLSFVDIFNQMKWEGHPCLWHLILAIPAKLGLPPIAMGVVSILFMIMSAILIMYKSPFHFGVKILLLFSSPFLYFYSIHSRVYSIIPFLICLLAIVYPKRMEKPLLFAILLAFLTNTHIMMSCLVGILSLFFVKDIITEKQYKNKKYWFALGIILLGIVILCLQIYESLSLNSIVENITSTEVLYSNNPLLNDLNKILYGFVEEINSFIGIRIYNMNYVYIIATVFFAMIIGMLFISFKSALIGFVSFIFIFLLHVFIWFSLPQRAVMLIILLMFAAWTNYYDNPSIKKWRFIVWEVILSIFCIISIPYGVKSYMYDVENPVSGALATSEYIQSNLPNAKFICPVDYVATSIAGYIDKDIFYSNIRQDYFTFVDWDSYWRKDVSYAYFRSTINDFAVSQDEDVYIIYSRYFLWDYDNYIDTMLENKVIKEIYKSPEGLSSETYWIYKLIN